jgi:thiamine-phosphate pyrophosphorylase
MNKTDVARIWEIEGLAEACELSKHPVLAIGGIDAINASAIVQAGSCGVAVIGAIHNAKNFKNEIRLLRHLIG